MTMQTSASAPLAPPGPAAQEAHQEASNRGASGYAMVAVGAVLALGGMALVASSADRGATAGIALGALLIVSGLLVFAGLYILQPNEAAILTLFGRYIGTDRAQGPRWANPLARRRKLSLRARNLNAATLKVNDKRGNPVEIAAVIVWRVRDTARAVFDVDDFELYVKVQTEAAVRHIASQFAYDEGEDLATGEATLRDSNLALQALQGELTERFSAAGVEVLEARLSHLAYAPEIAQVMLRRQQAEAIISARQKIVHGAVSMVEAALKGLSEKQIVDLDDERKAAMVSNLLVVLCSDKDTQPIVNAGTLYA